MLRFPWSRRIQLVVYLDPERHSFLHTLLPVQAVRSMAAWMQSIKQGRTGNVIMDCETR